MTRRYYRRPSHSDPVIVLLLIIGGISALALATQQLIARLGSLVPIILTLVAILAICFTIFLIYLAYQRYKISQVVSLTDLDHLTGEQFERYVVLLLKFLGYTNIRHNGGFHDKGADIIAQKDNDIYAIQVKRYATHNLVHRAAISDAVGALAVYGANKALVITSSYFSADAKAVAKANNCQLIDRKQLLPIMQAYHSPSKN